MKSRVNILGTEYKIEIHRIDDDSYMTKESCDGYCSEEEKLIVLADFTDKEHFPYMNEKEIDNYSKKVLRHELVHAFLNESGLSSSSGVPRIGWAKNEEMVDWLAIQYPKISAVFMELGVEE